MIDTNSHEYKQQRSKLLMMRHRALETLKNPNAPQELVNLAKPVFDKAEVALSLMDAQDRAKQKRQP